MLYLGLKEVLCVPSNCFPGSQGSSVHGKTPLQATGIILTHYGANITNQLSPMPHQKGLILFQPQSKLLKVLGFIQGLCNNEIYMICIIRISIDSSGRKLQCVSPHLPNLPIIFSKF